jgi:hypothetical protein
MISDVGLPLGRTAVFSQNTGPHSGNVLVNLVPRSQRARSDVQAAEAVRGALRDALPGTQVYMFIGGNREEDPELRRAGAGRHRDRRPRHRGRRGLREAGAARGCGRSTTRTASRG